MVETDRGMDGGGFVIAGVVRKAGWFDLEVGDGQFFFDHDERQRGGGWK